MFQSDKLCFIIQKLFDFLDDNCKFLHDEATYKKLPAKARKQADELVNRSRHFLQEIDKIYPELKNDNAISNSKKIVSDSNDNGKIGKKPYYKLPAKYLITQKSGPLIYLNKTRFGFERMHDFKLAGIHDDWLLCYSSPEDLKPTKMFDLHTVRAEPVISNSHEPSRDFLIINNKGKPYHFMASDYNDMDQWVISINEFGMYSSLSINLKESCSTTEDTYSDIRDTPPSVLAKKPVAKTLTFVPPVRLPNDKLEVNLNNSIESIYETVLPDDINLSKLPVPTASKHRPLPSPPSAKPKKKAPINPINTSLQEFQKKVAAKNDEHHYEILTLATSKTSINESIKKGPIVPLKPKK